MVSKKNKKKMFFFFFFFFFFFTFLNLEKQTWYWDKRWLFSIGNGAAKIRQREGQKMPWPIKTSLSLPVKEFTV